MSNFDGNGLRRVSVEQVAPSTVIMRSSAPVLDNGDSAALQQIRQAMNSFLEQADRDDKVVDVEITPTFQKKRSLFGGREQSVVSVTAKLNIRSKTPQEKALEQIGKAKIQAELEMQQEQLKMDAELRRGEQQLKLLVERQTFSLRWWRMLFQMLTFLVVVYLLVQVGKWYMDSQSKPVNPQNPLVLP